MPSTAEQTVFATVVVTKNVTLERVQNLLTSFFENHCGWCTLMGYQFAPGLCYEDFCDKRPVGPLGKLCNPDDYSHPSQIIPITDGCASKLVVEEYKVGIPNEWTPTAKEKRILGNADYHCILLTKEKLVKGITIFAEKFPKHFNDWMTENDDIITADLFVQCCLFGEEIFG